MRMLKAGVRWAILIAAVVGIASWTWAASRLPKAAPSPTTFERAGIEKTVRKVDQHIAQVWRDRNLVPALPVDDLTFARRSALGIVGAIPSLEEIRWLESQPVETRRTNWIEKLLADPRYSEFTAERLTEAWLPREIGENFILYRRRRFVEWLTDQIDAGRPLTEIARAMIAGQGLWTDSPEVNFVTSYLSDPEHLAGQTTRSFLGLSLDCAQCHDHPFAPWKQEEFRGLASYYGRTQMSLRGVTDDRRMHKFQDNEDSEGVFVKPEFPYDACTAPEDARLREQLADWVTHPDNTRFAEAAANRVWQMMFGQPVVDPVDNLDGAVALEGLLPILAEDFRQNGHDLRRLFRVIAASEAFSIASTLDAEATDKSQAAFASFPVSRLTPSQIARSLIQVSSLRTLDGESSLLGRLQAFFDRQDFVRYFQNSSDDRSSTVAQRLMLMNDKVVRQRLRAADGNASEMIAKHTEKGSSAIEIAYLVCLTRRPDEAETQLLAKALEIDKRRPAAMEDLFWALINSTEFCWLR